MIAIRACVRAAVWAALLCGGGAAIAGPDKAAENYLLHCAGCHREDGSGSAQNQVPTMLNSVGHFVRTARGRSFLIQVAGVSQAPISDQAVADLLNWLLPTFGRDALPDAGYAPYTASEVEQARATRPGDIMTVRQQVAAELAALGHPVANY